MFQYAFTIELSRGVMVPSGACRLLRIAESFPFSVRSMSRAEFARWRADSSCDMTFQDQVLAECVLAHPDRFQEEPWEWDAVYAGVVQQVFEKIMGLSGFGPAPDPELIGNAEQYLRGEEARYDLLLMTAFNYRLEEILALDSELWHRLVGLAEMKLVWMGFDPNQILNPEAVKKKGGQVGGAAAHLPPAGAVRGAPGPQARTEQAFMFTSE